ncbi:MAG: NUDIX hydrolase [Candidatus Pacebacteria bacterium]|nr:NUDIX hydrolase [Candidatus Paceibacterota bacterium]
MNNKITITICGSVAFARAILTIAARLEKRGFIVNVPLGLELFLPPEKHQELLNSWGQAEGAERKIRYNLIKDYYEKIKKSDAILVINKTKKGIKGYIGGNTFLEMGFAHVLGKKIYVLNPLPKNLGLIYQELLAFQPTILNGDLAEIKVCPHRCVGMLVWRKNKLLLIERRKSPFGYAPPAGHLKKKEFFKEAARRELKEESGLEAVSLKLVTRGRKDNQCRRLKGSWHSWRIYQAKVRGKIRPNLDEVVKIGWYSSYQLKKMANRTKKFIKGEISQNDWQKSPGLEVVWLEWLRKLEII